LALSHELPHRIEIDSPAGQQWTVRDP